MGKATVGNERGCFPNLAKFRVKPLTMHDNRTEILMRASEIRLSAYGFHKVVAESKSSVHGTKSVIFYFAPALQKVQDCHRNILANVCSCQSNACRSPGGVCSPCIVKGVEPSLELASL